MVSYADQEEASPSLGAAKCETIPTFGWSWEAPRSGAIRRLECGLAVPGGRELRNRPHVSGPPGGPAEWCHNEASPSLGAANCETVASFGCSWRPSGVMPRADQNEASPPLKFKDGVRRPSST